MQIGTYTFHRYHHSLILIQHGLLLWVLFYHFSFLGILAGLFAKELFKGVGDEIGAHRYFTHKSFKTTKFKENLLIFLHFFNMQGPLLSYVGIHRMHHAFTDTEKDPHTPLKGKLKVLYWLNPISVNPSMVRDYLKDFRFRFLAKWYYELYIGFSIIFIFLFGLVPYVYIFSFSAILGLYLNGLVNIYCHDGIGTQDFVTGESSRNKNSTAMVFLLKGGHLHNNHHAHAASSTTKVESHDYDFFGIIINKFFKL